MKHLILVENQSAPGDEQLGALPGGTIFRFVTGTGQLFIAVDGPTTHHERRYVALRSGTLFSASSKRPVVPVPEGTRFVVQDF